MGPSRRMFVKSGAGLVALSAFAGCSEDDPGAGDGSGEDDTQPEPEPEPEPESELATVTLLVEGVDGHDHDDDHHHDDHHDDDHHDDHHDDDHHDDDHHDDHGAELSDHDIDHACGHMEFDDPELLDGGSSADNAPIISSTHQPYNVEFEGDSAFVTFESDEDDDHHHDDDHDHGNGSTLALFTHGGSITVHTGHKKHEEHGVGGCADVDEYVVVESDHDVVTVELTPDA